MFKYTLWIPEKETMNDLFLTVNARNKLQALYKLRKNYKWNLIEFEDDELFSMIQKIG